MVEGCLPDCCVKHEAHRIRLVAGVGRIQVQHMVQCMIILNDQPKPALHVGTSEAYLALRKSCRTLPPYKLALRQRCPYQSRPPPRLVQGSQACSLTKGFGMSGSQNQSRTSLLDLRGLGQDLDVYCASWGPMLSCPIYKKLQDFSLCQDGLQ